MPEEAEEEKIVDIGGGTFYSVFVTEQGRLYACGDRILKQLRMDYSEHRVVKIDMPAGYTALKAYGTNAKKQPALFVLAKDAEGNNIMLSAGKSDVGLLGQGSTVKESKVLTPMAYDAKDI